MDLRMTRQTPARDKTLVRETAISQCARRLQVIRMTHMRVTLLAKERNGCHQQRVLIGAVRRVAVKTGISHWRMLEKKRTTLFRMTLVTSLIDRGSFHQHRIERAMRIVTVRTCHQTFRQGHVGASIEL